MGSSAAWTAETGSASGPTCYGLQGKYGGRFGCDRSAAIRLQGNRWEFYGCLSSQAPLNCLPTWALTLVGFSASGASSRSMCATSASSNLSSHAFMHQSGYSCVFPCPCVACKRRAMTESAYEITNSDKGNQHRIKCKQQANLDNH